MMVSMRPWEKLASATAPDGQPIDLRRRGDEYLILAGGHDLMSSEDEPSSRALAELGCAHLDPRRPTRVLVGGLGMGFTLRAALDHSSGEVEVVELVTAIVDWNRGALGALAGRPLDDPRCRLHLGDVNERIASARARYDAILLDVDNGPHALAHDANDALYNDAGLDRARAALRPGGALAVWSFSDDPRFTRRLGRRGFSAKLHRVEGSRKGRGRYHYIWVAQPRHRS